MPTLDKITFYNWCYEKQHAVMTFATILHDVANKLLFPWKSAILATDYHWTPSWGRTFSRRHERRWSLLSWLGWEHHPYHYRWSAPRLCSPQAQQLAGDWNGFCFFCDRDKTRFWPPGNLTSSSHDDFLYFTRERDVGPELLLSEVVKSLPNVPRQRT